MADNVSTVLEIYEAFGRGDVPAILAKLDEDVEWEKGRGETSAPWLAARRGRAGVGEFFQVLGEHLDITTFEPAGEPMVGSATVAVPIRFEATVRANGNRIVEPIEIHLWWFDADGKVTAFLHVNDVGQHERALAG